MKKLILCGLLLVGCEARFESKSSHEPTIVGKFYQDEYSKISTELADCKAQKGPNIEVKFDFYGVKVSPEKGSEDQEANWLFTHNYISMGKLVSDENMEEMKKVIQSTYSKVGEAYEEAKEAQQK